MKNNRIIVVFFAVLVLAMLMAVSVSADQEGNKRWCNSDKYGCWVTDENGGQSYIMFWSESAREYFMGPNSSAPVAPALPGGEMELEAAPAGADSLTMEQLIENIKNKYYEALGYSSPDGMNQGINYMINERGMTPEEIDKSIADWLERNGQK